MSGKVPPSSRAGRKNPRGSDIEKARDIVERFKGDDAVSIGVWDVPETPSVMAIIGPLDSVSYTTVRDGKTERYVHDFAKADRPLLAVSPDSKQLYIVGGRYIFTERGIVDLSDRKNLPRSLR